MNVMFSNHFQMASLTRSEMTWQESNWSWSGLLHYKYLCRKIFVLSYQNWHATTELPKFKTFTQHLLFSTLCKTLPKHYFDIRSNLTFPDNLFFICAVSISPLQGKTNNHSMGFSIAYMKRKVMHMKWISTMCYPSCNLHRDHYNMLVSTSEIQCWFEIM